MNKKKNIVLIGYRGTGKSTIAAALARRLDRKIISTDALIVAEVGMPISDIVERYGWERFREEESKSINRLTGTTDSIIDCGGGVVERKENITLLKQSGIILLLVAEAAIIVKRIEGDNTRPSLQNGYSLKEEVVCMLQKRQDRYEKAADMTINTSKADLATKKGVDCIVEKVIKQLQRVQLVLPHP